MKGQRNLTRWAIWETTYLTRFLKFQKKQNCVARSYLHGYKGWTRGVVQATQLALRVEVCGGGRLRFDYGGEFVGGVIHSSSVGKVDEGAGRDAVTTRRRTPKMKQQSQVSSKIPLKQKCVILNSRHYYYYYYTIIITWCWDLQQILHQKALHREPPPHAQLRAKTHTKWTENYMLNVCISFFRWCTWPSTLLCVEIQMC